MKNQKQVTEEKVSQARILQFVRKYGTQRAADLVNDAAACIQVSSRANRNQGNEKTAKLQAETYPPLYELADDLRKLFKDFAFPESPMPEQPDAALTK